MHEIQNVRERERSLVGEIKSGVCGDIWTNRFCDMHPNGNLFTRVCTWGGGGTKALQRFTSRDGKEERGSLLSRGSSS
jgi:hypothetical protein